MPLLQAETSAVPVLTEVLASRDAEARLLAAEDLEKVGEGARPAVPALLWALDDEDETVREQVGQALFRIDRQAAERAGLERTIRGLMRRCP
jgi:HEAT repeat protein